MNATWLYTYAMRKPSEPREVFRQLAREASERERPRTASPQVIVGHSFYRGIHRIERCGRCVAEFKRLMEVNR